MVINQYYRSLLWWRMRSFYDPLTQGVAESFQESKNWLGFILSYLAHVIQRDLIKAFSRSRSSLIDNWRLEMGKWSETFDPFITFPSLMHINVSNKPFNLWFYLKSMGTIEKWPLYYHQIWSIFTRSSNLVSLHQVRRMMEIFCVGDKFKMFVTDFFHEESHQHKTFITIKSTTYRSHQ